MKRITIAFCFLIILAAMPSGRTDVDGRPDPNAPAPPAPVNDKTSTLVEKYVFDAGSGDSVADPSNSANTAALKNCTWVSPGYNGAKAALHLDGKTSCIPLAIGKTPATAMAVKLVVRPAALTGMLYGDVGGLIVSIQPNGAILFMRVCNGKWAAVVSKDQLSVDEWSTVECQWDGSMNRIFIDGKLSVEGPAGSSFASGPRGLGCNFYDSSAFFSGDIQSFELRKMNGE